LHLARTERRFLRALWYGRSVRTQLLLAFVLIDFLAVLVAGSVAIVRARTQIGVEMASSMRLAEFLVGDAAKFVHHQFSADELLAELPKQLHSLRHVRITVKDTAGAAIAAPLLGRLADERPPAPGWFSLLVAAPVKRGVVPVTVNGRTLGQVEITGEPADETAEVWGNLVAMGGVAVVLNIAMIGILYFLFGRVLDPLAVLATALSDLEHRSYGVRLPRSNARELTGIADRFNALASALETARSQNQELNRRLITAQDDERRRTALELHDEVGPCLFGLKAYGSSIAAATSALAGEMGQNLSECSREILAITEHLQSINRSMLDRLRPMALGHVPLAELLGQLVHERSRQHPQILFDCALGTRSYGDSIDLTIYRCIQESLTNAIRHARAKQVRVEARHDSGTAMLELTVQDDGRGMPADTPSGFGIRGMRERVEALGGHHSIASEPGRGTCIRISIPVARSPNAAAADVEEPSGVHA
jgi:two-component system sensor histidine kinase UhpB